MNQVHALIAALMADNAGNVVTKATPAQFASGKELANMEAVQRALGGMAGIKYVNAPYTLQASDAGHFIIASGTGIVTYPANLFPAGVGVAISAKVSADNITVAHSMPFSYGGSQINGIALRNNENVSIISQGNGTSPLVYAGGLRSSPDFQNLLAAPGYQKLPSGFTLQWGTASGLSSGARTVSLPIAAETGILAAFAIIQSSAVGYIATVSDTTLNKTDFKLHTWSNATTRADAAAFWVAITY